ncbi:hypothetical protein BKA62DRAFT_713798 [Auriculariales sp. MPI-PUGE-AT-0066]|nr:hypothetical protein BKA62DRAFT_713798 [Auriculariales sp. MPI-PUGE-AT-0066]
MSATRYCVSCAICQEELLPNDEQRSPVVLSCGHIFCKRDLERHIQAGRQRRGPTTCPICREPLNEVKRVYFEEVPVDSPRRVSMSSAPARKRKLRAAVQVAQGRVQSQEDGEDLDQLEDTVASVEQVILDGYAVEDEDDPEARQAIQSLARNVEKIRRSIESARRANRDEVQQLRNTNQVLENNLSKAILLAEMGRERTTDLQTELNQYAAKYAELQARYRKEAAGRLEAAKRAQAAEDRIEKMNKLRAQKVHAAAKASRHNTRRREASLDDSLEIV